MKKILLSAAFVAVSFLNANAQVVIDFDYDGTNGTAPYILEQANGHFNTLLSFAGEGANSSANALKVDIEALDAVTYSRQELRPGGATTLTDINATPIVGMFVKVVSLSNNGTATKFDIGMVEDGGSRVTTTTVLAAEINDGNWHFVGFDMTDDAIWTDFAGVSNSLTDGASLRIRHVGIKIGGANGDTGTFLIDEVGYYAQDPTLSNTAPKLAEIKAYPNPVVNTLNLDLSKQVSSVTVYSAIGSVVYTNEAPSKNLTIDTQAWKAGMYFVSVKEGNQKQILKIIK